jgi:hypothetical protein
LKRSVIGNIELPIGAQIRRPAVLQVSVSDRQQICDFLLGGLMLLHPSELAPIL